MKASNSKTGQKKPYQQRPASTPDGVEQQIQSLAMTRALERLKDGTASNQLIVEVMKSASKEKRLKMEIMEAQRDLLKAKTESINEQKNMNEMYVKAIDAMRSYAGLSKVGVDDEDEEIF